jgi:hypothetical protein
MSAAIVFADGSIWRGSVGDADVATGVQVTPDTSFSIASVSKTFTAALTLALIEDGRLSLDGAAKSYLPSLPIDSRITVRELLDHTSGLRTSAGAGVDHALLSKPARVWTRPDRSSTRQAVREARPRVALLEPNYLVSGSRRGGRWRAARGPAPDRFFGPLDLDDTYYQRPGEPWPGPSRAAIAFLGTDPKLPDRPVGRHGDRAVHLGRDAAGGPAPSRRAARPRRLARRSTVATS